MTEQTLVDKLAGEIREIRSEEWRNLEDGLEEQFVSKVKAKLEAAFREYTNKFIKEAVRIDGKNDAWLAIKLAKASHLAGITLTEEKA